MYTLRYLRIVYKAGDQPVASLLVIVNAVAMPATAVLVPAPVATVERI
jgi:hypothetical protein